MKTDTIQIILDTESIEKLDGIASELGISRSRAGALAIRKFLDSFLVSISSIRNVQHVEAPQSTTDIPA